MTPANDNRFDWFAIGCSVVTTFAEIAAMTGRDQDRAFKEMERDEIETVLAQREIERMP